MCNTLRENRIIYFSVYFYRGKYSRHPGRCFDFCDGNKQNSTTGASSFSQSIFLTYRRGRRSIKVPDCQYMCQSIKIADSSVIWPFQRKRRIWYTQLPKLWSRISLGAPKRLIIQLRIIFLIARNICSTFCWSIYVQIKVFSDKSEFRNQILY